MSEGLEGSDTPCSRIVNLYHLFTHKLFGVFLSLDDLYYYFTFMRIRGGDAGFLYYRD